MMFPLGFSNKQHYLSGQVEGLGGLAQVEEKNEEQRPFEVEGKKIFSNCSKKTKARAGEKMDKKGGKGQSECWKA